MKQLLVYASNLYFYQLSVQLRTCFWKGWWRIVACAFGVDPEHLTADVCCLTGVDVLFKYKLKVLQVEQTWQMKKVSLALTQAFY